MNNLKFIVFAGVFAVLAVIGLWSSALIQPETAAAQDVAQPAQASTEVAEATPTPRTAGLQRGESRAIALATDTAMQPTPRAEVAFAEDNGPVSLAFSEFYDGFHPRYGLVLSDKLVSLDGMEVTLEGYMAPPLKPALDWFVVTRIPLALCPFCSTDADWPNDIALAYMPDGEEVIATEKPLRLTGTLQVGISEDAETGMVSLVRLYVEDYETVE